MIRFWLSIGIGPLLQSKPHLGSTSNWGLVGSWSLCKFAGKADSETASDWLLRPLLLDEAALGVRGIAPKFAAVTGWGVILGSPLYTIYAAAAGWRITSDSSIEVLSIAPRSFLSPFFRGTTSWFPAWEHLYRPYFLLQSCLLKRVERIRLSSSTPNLHRNTY